MLIQELNIGGSLVTSALEDACGTSRSKIRDMYNELGDLGRTRSLKHFFFVHFPGGLNIL